MRRRLALTLALLPALLLAGCTQLDAAKEQVDAAKEQLDEARRELDEARARYDRVRSLTAVRQEVLDVTLTPTLRDDGAIAFEINATRGGAAIPLANLTAVTPVALRVTGGPWVLCDPLSCAAQVPPGGALEVRASPEAPDAMVVEPQGATLSCGDEPCALRLAGTRAWVTTAIGDATT